MSDPLWIERLDMLPADARPHVRRYLEHGYGSSLAGFYRAVLSNDLIGAVALADADNRAALPDFVDYLVSSAPIDCYGSPERVEAWRGTTAVGGHDLQGERLVSAQGAYADHAFPSDCSVVQVGDWCTAERSSHPDRTLMRRVTLAWQGREYVRVFAVVFHPGQASIEGVFFGDLLP